MFLTLAAPLVAALMMRIHPSLRSHSRRALLMVWLALVTHPLLDCFTVYGTQILLPFSDYPVTWSTIFIIDPIYSVPLITAVIGAWVWFASRSHQARRACLWGLAISSAYLLGTVAMKIHVDSLTRVALSQQRIPAQQFLTTPGPFNTLLWRILVMQEDGYLEGFYSLFDGSPTLEFTPYPSEPTLLDPIAREWTVQRLTWFTKGFYRVREEPQGISITDLRMGVEPFYVFSFRVGRRGSEEIVAVPAEQLAPVSVNLDRLMWIWERIWNGPQAGNGLPSLDETSLPNPPLQVQPK